MQRAYIGLGSNIDQPRLQIKTAMAALDALDAVHVLADSGYYRSRPMGPADQPDYINAVVEIDTSLTPQALLRQCQQIEQQQGRVKKRHWGERCIDLDILLYAQQQIVQEDLTIPHPGICERDFVYMPLLKLSPNIHIPGIGPLKQQLAAAHAAAQGASSDYACVFTGDIQ
ncbi:MAG TPA: 2-amino-4-hydroxy-6-hydroxymethyldihydropteridine diphosphokinase [Gammaproteobacteria bacterium]|nr:2-amino-4-hydroxy-6-hydroxymethyldihydropteridine diphosphokinase [Gammaproteobacteria bacterium]